MVSRPHLNGPQVFLRPLCCFLPDLFESFGLFIGFGIFGSLVKNQEIEIGCVIIGFDFERLLQVVSRTRIVLLLEVDESSFGISVCIIRVELKRQVQLRNGFRIVAFLVGNSPGSNGRPRRFLSCSPPSQ